MIQGTKFAEFYFTKAPGLTCHLVFYKQESKQLCSLLISFSVCPPECRAVSFEQRHNFGVGVVSFGTWLYVIDRGWGILI